jgi:hypothetical protein
MNITLKCENCNNEFIAKFKHRDKKFCNRNCYFEYANKHKTLGRPIDNDVREIRKCLQCGSEFTERKKYDRKICSDECRTIWNNNPINIENRIIKSKESLKEKYGIDTLFKSIEFQKNLKKSFLEKYGVKHPMAKQEFVEKLKNTIKRNHLPKLIESLKTHNIQLLDEYINNKDGNTSRPYNFKCNRCDYVFTSTLLGSGKIPICRKCFPITKNSNLETFVKDFLNENGIYHINGDRKILNGKELDILIPNNNIAIEINGHYYHSEIHGSKDKKYHIGKTICANEKEIKLIHIMEDEIILKEEIVKSRLRNILGLINNKIYARKCDIRIVEKKESENFLNKNHIQGNSIDKIRIGLYHNEELVSLMTFGHKRKVLGNKKTNSLEFELIRFCNKINTNVIGSFSKLLKYFIKTHNPKSIITYADIRWSGINPKETVYNKNGFKYLGLTTPNYWYVNIGKFIDRHHRFTFRKDILVKEGFDKNKTEWEIMKEKSFDRIWDCGSMKFEMLF